jgi:hypothetical protein
MEDDRECEQTNGTNNARQGPPVDPAMPMTNLLLPFTHGVDASAINYALALAQRFQSTLVVLSLIRLPEASRARKPRLEAIQQSRDFLEFVQCKAARQGVPIMRVELYTHHPVRSIRTLAQEMDCSGILLFVHRGAGVLLATTEVKQLLEDDSLPLYIARLHADESGFPGFGWLARWLGRRKGGRTISDSKRK